MRKFSVRRRKIGSKEKEQRQTTLGNNCVAFMFDEIRYELNGVEINRTRNVEITSSIKNYISLTYDKALIMRNAGWNIASTIPERYLNFCVPLNTLLGFCEDHKRVIVNLACHELILIRTRSNNNCLVGIQRHYRKLIYLKYSGECLTLY